MQLTGQHLKANGREFDRERLAVTVPPATATCEPCRVAFQRRCGCISSGRFDPLTTGIMSENVQQRFLFSKKPNYGPLATPIVMRPPDPVKPPKANSGSVGSAGESWRYVSRRPERNIKAKSWTGDARHGGGGELSLFNDSGGKGVMQRSEASEYRLVNLSSPIDWGRM